jgi:hypothetical protein
VIQRISAAKELFFTVFRERDRSSIFKSFFDAVTVHGSYFTKLYGRGDTVARIEEVTVSLIDDFDGTEAAETVKFSIDGKSYEIDLSKANANELRRTLRPYIDRARAARRSPAARRTTKSASGRRGPARRSEGYDRTEVRAWAKANRIKVAPRGRISNDIVEKWRNASK